MTALRSLPLPSALAPYVAGLWIEAEAGEGAGTDPPGPYKVLPGPFPVLGFQIRGRLNVLRGVGEETLSRSGITGLCTSPRWFRPEPETRTVLAVLKPEAAFSFLAQDLGALAEEHVDLAALLPPGPLRILEESISEAPSGRAGAGLITDFLVSLAERSRFRVHPAVQAAARRLLAGHGRERVEPIAADLGISRRQLERLFRLQIGLPPKRFASLVRFDWVVRHLDHRASWTDLALEAGYADQAHLIRSFSELAGTTPERYVRGAGPPDVAFLQDRPTAFWLTSCSDERADRSFKQETLMNALIRAAIDQAAQGEIPYPVLAKTLRESGIRTYHVDVATHTAVYQGDEETFTIKGEDVARAGENAPAFDPSGIVAALLASQRREIDYDGFLQRIWRSGATSYDVDLEARRITYKGQNGEAHVERIPEV